MKKSYKLILPVVIIVFGLVAAYTVLAQTESQPAVVGGGNAGTQASKIIFPVPELGNCANQEECKSYCDKPENVDACVSFAKANGLMDKNEAEMASKFGKKVLSGEGPLGCKGAQECEKTCSNIQNLDACVKWADENGVKGDNFSEAKKIQSFIKKGGQMPGGCTSKEACQTYCEDLNHIEECMAFAQNAGLDMGGPEGPGGPGRDKGGAPADMKKMIELVKSGQTPGGCKTKTECDAYCGGGNHFEECISFAEKAGFMTSEEAAKIKKTGGKGPGGCTSDASCRAFCDDPAHREECFKFAEDNGLISPEDLKQAKEGMVRMRQGLDNAPPEVKDCLQSSLGQSVLEDIQSGKLVPGPQVGEQAKSCFEKFGGKFSPADALKNAPPEITSCLKDKGVDIEAIKSGKTEMTPEMGDTLRVCFESVKFSGPNGPGGPTGGTMMGGGQAFNLSEFLRSAPSAVVGCFETALGSDFEKIKSGETAPTPELGDKIKTCFEQFRPGESRPGMMSPANGGPSGNNIMSPGQPRQFQPGAGGQNGASGPNFPTAVSECLKKNLSEGQVADLMRGERPSGEAEQIIGKCFSENQGSSGNFMPPQGQPGQSTQTGQVPPVGQIPGGQPNGEFRPPEGFQPPTGGQFAPPPGGFPSGQMPPAGMMPPQGFIPPEGFTPPPGDQLPPPPTGGIQPPPSEPPTGGSSFNGPLSIIGAIIAPFIGIIFGQ